MIQIIVNIAVIQAKNFKQIITIKYNTIIIELITVITNLKLFFESSSFLLLYALENLHFIGLINDDKTEVGQVHIGVVYECEVDKSNVVVREDDTLEIKWTTGDDARKEENYETWSEFLKPIF